MWVHATSTSHKSAIARQSVHKNAFIRFLFPIIYHTTLSRVSFIRCGCNNNNKTVIDRHIRAILPCTYIFSYASQWKTDYRFVEEWQFSLTHHLQHLYSGLCENQHSDRASNTRTRNYVCFRSLSSAVIAATHRDDSIGRLAAVIFHWMCTAAQHHYTSRHCL